MNKKIAICISGYLRTFENCYQSIKENLIQDYDCDIFIHTYDKIRAKPSYHNQDYYDRERDYSLNLDFFEKIPNLKSLVIENFDDIKGNFLKFQNRLGIDYMPAVYMAPYKIYKCNELKKKYERDNNFIYDVVIRTRGDQVFTKKINFNFPENKILINSYPFGDEDYIHNCTEKEESRTVGYLNDRFAAGSSENIDYLSDLYNHLETYLAEPLFSPIERLFYLHLEGKELEKRNLGFYVKHEPPKESCRLCGKNLIKKIWLKK